MLLLWLGDAAPDDDDDTDMIMDTGTNVLFKYSDAV